MDRHDPADDEIAARPPGETLTKHRQPLPVISRTIGASEGLVMDHGSDTDDDPARFRVTVSFDEQADGKTVLTLRQLHPTVEQRDATIGFGAVELSLQTMQKLARHLGDA
jgi:uncharacterized protein YndB with AHSA1/START domain